MVGQSLYEEFLNRGWNVEDTAAMAITFDELDTVKQRTDGAADALIAEGFPADQIHRAAERTTDVPGAFEAASALLAKHQKVKHWLVFSVNDEGVLGALRALEQRGYAADDIVAIGIGAGDGLMEWNKQEETGYFACALISPVRHGYETSELMYKWIKDGIEPPKTIYTAGELVTRENYKERAKALGLDL
jgi:L-arabinose transport system substrate-binding protein